MVAKVQYFVLPDPKLSAAQKPNCTSYLKFRWRGAHQLEKNTKSYANGMVCLYLLYCMKYEYQVHV